MDDAVKQKLIYALKLVAALASVYYLALFLYISLSRWSFPLTFDWVEGPGLVQVNRLLQGQDLYVEPGANYVPLVYQPLYFYVAAAFTKLLGLGLGPSRLLSILASCGCLLLIFVITQKTTRSRFAGVVSAGLFAATNGIVWTWFDFAKVDLLCVFLSLLGLYFLLRATVGGTILAGIFFTLSFFTKQSALIVILPAFAFYFLVNQKQALLFILVVGALTSAGVLGLNSISHGWYALYAFTLPSYHRLDTNPVQISYVATSLLEPVLIFIGMVLASILTNLKKFFQDKQFYFLFGLSSSTLVFSILSALSVGTTRNAFIPAYALFAILCGKGLQAAQENLTASLPAKLQFGGQLALLGICLLQFSGLQYPARPYLPSAQDFKRANALIKELQETEGEFLIPSQNYLGLMVHKNAYYHDAPLGEFTGWYGRSLPEWPKIKAEIQELVTSGQVSAVYLTEPLHDWMGLRCEKEKTLPSKSKFVPTLYKMSCH